MYKQLKCPECSQVMIGEMSDGETIYMCPTHSYSQPISKPNGVFIHMSNEMASQSFLAGDAIRKALFLSLND